MRGTSKLEALYEGHADAVRAFVYRRIEPSAAEDVVSEVFVVAWRRIDQVPENERTWLLGVARRALANQRRSVRRQVALLQRLAEHGDTRQPGIDDPSLIDSAVLIALSELRPQDREVLLLTAWDGLSPADAAEVLGLRPTAFSMRLSRARERLRDRLDAVEPSVPSHRTHQGTRNAV